MSEFKACCDPGTTWEGTPVGQEATFSGLSTYIAKPENALSGGPAIVLIHDIFGWGTKNVRLYADNLARQGYLAVVPDFFHGKSLQKPLDFSKVPAFLADFPTDKVIVEVKAVVKALKEEHSASAIGAQGFCWGGLYTALLLAGSDGADAGVISHGSLLKEENVQAIERPVWFQFSDNDRQISTEFRLQIEGILKDKPGCGSKFYDGQEHGWTLRGDDKDPAVAAAAADALSSALEFFQAHLRAQ